MEEEQDVVFLKIFDREKGDVLFEGKVSTDVEPGELVHLRCFWDQGFYGFYNKATNEQVVSFKGLRNKVELVAGWSSDYIDSSGVLYVGAEDGVLRTSKCVPSCECVMMMSVWELSQEECEKAFKCEVLEELELSGCKLRQIPTEIGKIKLKKLRLERLNDLTSIPEEMGDLSSLKELWMKQCGIESLPKRLKDLKTLRMISCVRMSNLQLNAEDLVVFSKLKHLRILNSSKVFTAPFTQSFWQMIKSTTDLRVVELDWWKHVGEMVVAALEENGSIVDGGFGSESYAQIFKRNKENHERALQCIVQLLAIRRWRDALSNVPKEMVRMIAMMLWITRCDVNAWAKI